MSCPHSSDWGQPKCSRCHEDRGAERERARIVADCQMADRIERIVCSEPLCILATGHVGGHYQPARGVCHHGFVVGTCVRCEAADREADLIAEWLDADDGYDSYLDGHAGEGIRAREHRAWDERRKEGR